MEVYIVTHEWGIYDDWSRVVDGVFATLEDARAHIRGQGRTVTLCRDGSYAELCDFEFVDAVGTVTLVPVESPGLVDWRSEHQVGGDWDIPRDPSTESDTWRIERWEVQR